MGGISCCRFTVEGFKLPQTTDFRVSDVLGSEISAAAITNPHQIKRTVVSYINDQILDTMDVKISILARPEVILTRSTVILTHSTVVWTRLSVILTSPATI